MAQEKIIEKPGQTITRILAADVSECFLPVVPTTTEGEVKIADSANADIEGILLQTGKAGDAVSVMVDGICRVRVDSAVARLAHLITSSNGRMVAPTLTSGTTYNIGGRAFTKATAAGEFVSVQIMPRKLRLK